MKILDLFSGTQSVRKGLIELNIDYEYIGLDIYSPEEDNTIFDLSQDDIITKILLVLPKDWKPDFIWASPVCNKFSVLHRMQNGNYYFEKTPNGLKPRENFDCRMPKNYDKKDHSQAKIDAVLHLKLVKNMFEIIDYFNCNFIIENPLHSFMERLMPFEYKKNRADYCAYGYKYQKPTAIYSNDLLYLKRCKCNGIHEENIQDHIGMTYARKSSVPPLLIKDILKYFIKEETK